MAVRITVKHQLTLSEQEECWGFVVDTPRDSSSEGKAQVGARLRRVQQHREKPFSVNNV